MNFNHIEYAVEVAKAKSIRKASQNLYVSQPYLSGIIKGLEKELGYYIFNRTAAGITLTKEGENFMQSAKIILREVKKIKEINADTEEHSLNISCYYATYIMEKFLKFHNSSNYKFSDKIKEMGNEEVLESISSGESDIGIIFYAREKQKKYQNLIAQYNLLAYELLKPMQMYAFMHKSHPLACMKTMRVANLSDYPYVTYNDASSKRYLEILKIQDHPELLEVSDRGSFYDALKSGEYMTSMGFGKPPLDKDFVLLPFEDKNIQMCSSYVTTKNYRLSKREKNFIEFLRADYSDKCLVQEKIKGFESEEGKK